MRKTLLTFSLLFVLIVCKGQTNDSKTQIYTILNQQVRDWNAGDIAAFMKGYWNSDSLMFVGKAGVTYGYDATYQNYLKRYPDRATMGKLTFDFINLTYPSEDVAFLVGKFHLERPEKGDASGYYTLLWRRINGQWLIVCDHTSG